MVFTFRENLHGCENCPNQDMCRSLLEIYFTIFCNISETDLLTTDGKYFRLILGKQNISDIFEKVNSYKIFQRHDPCMGWYCPGGVRKEGDVLKCLGKKNQETRKKTRKPESQEGNVLKCLGKQKPGNQKPKSQEGNVLKRKPSNE